jgi:hypothetical protein
MTAFREVSEFVDDHVIYHEHRRLDETPVEIDIAVHVAGARDWIYAADFAARSNSVYLAGYSGRVVMANSAGEGLRVYDIGNPPKRIIDTGEYVYIPTHTRLYVLRDDWLHALVDTTDSGELVLASSRKGERLIKSIAISSRSDNSLCLTIG